MTDREALEKLRQSGKPGAEGIAHLYRRYAPRFLGYFLRHRLPRQDADEVVRETFIGIVRDCDLYQGERRFDAWMGAIARGRLAK